MSLFVRQIHTSVLRIVAKNHYQVLGVSRDASSKEIRAAFIRLSKQLHPDVNKTTLGDDDVSFVDINEAYSVLSNPTSRKEYDLRQTQGPLIQHNTGPFTSHTYGPGRGHYFYTSQHNMYHYNEEQRKFSNATVAGFLCIFIIVGSVLQFLRFNGFMKTQRAATERSRRNYILYDEARKKAQRNLSKSKTA